MDAVFGQQRTLSAASNLAQIFVRVLLCLLSFCKLSDGPGPPYSHPHCYSNLICEPMLVTFHHSILFLRTRNFGSWGARISTTPAFLGYSYAALWIHCERMFNEFCLSCPKLFLSLRTGFTSLATSPLFMFFRTWFLKFDPKFRLVVTSFRRSCP